MLTVYEDNERIFQALTAGASGYLVKRTPPPKIIEAIHEVHAGGSPMTPQIARRVVQLIGPLPREADRHGSALGAFTAGTCLTDALRAALAARGIGDVAVEAVPLPMQ